VRRGGSREESLVDQCAVMDNDVLTSEWLNTPSCFIYTCSNSHTLETSTVVVIIKFTFRFRSTIIVRTIP